MPSATGELTEEEQRDVLNTTSAWIPLPPPATLIGAGGGARVFPVLSRATHTRLTESVKGIRGNTQPDDIGRHLLEFLSNFVAGKEYGICAGKVATRPDPRIKREIEVLCDVKHTNLITMIDHDRSEKPTWYVMPVMNGGTLSAKSYVGNIPAVVRGMLEVSRALAALHGHQQPITHRDIKPKNIFLSDRGEWILGDPGVAYRDDGADETETRPVSKDWAPRWYDDKLARSPKADLYMLAGTALAMVAGGDVKPLDPSFLDEEAFDLPTRFPEASGVGEFYQLLRSLIATKPTSIPFADARQLVPALEALLLLVVKDDLQRLRDELNQVRRRPQSVYSYTNSFPSMTTGTQVALDRVAVWIPDDCTRLAFFQRSQQGISCTARLHSAGGQQAYGEVVMAEGGPIYMSVSSDIRGQYAMLAFEGPTGMLHSIAVYAEHY